MDLLGLLFICVCIVNLMMFDPTHRGYSITYSEGCYKPWLYLADVASWHQMSNKSQTEKFMQWYPYLMYDVILYDDCFIDVSDE